MKDTAIVVEQELSNIYYDPGRGYQSMEKLFYFLLTKFSIIIASIPAIINIAVM